MTCDQRFPGETTADLATVLTRELSHHFGRPVHVETFIRLPSAYASSSTLEELRVRLKDGHTFNLIFKAPAVTVEPGSPRMVKPPFLRNVRRELEVYSNILTPGGVTAPTYFGGDADLGWLFLEKVNGVALFQVGAFGTWETVARWLGRHHEAYRGRTHELERKVPFVRHDAALYRRWPRRAQDNLLSYPSAVRRRFDNLAVRFDRVVDRILAEPVTFLHGDFYPSNVMIEEGAAGPVVRPIDWDLAGLGPGAYDLASLVAGRWTEARRRDLATAYLDQLPDERFWDLLEHARLLIAVQWLGWATGWIPPSEHAQDWLTEVFDLSESLGL